MLGLALVLVGGVLSQWLAWRLRLPSILLLLLVGFVAGPITGWLDPDELLGDALFPIVSLSVAAILLEGGLTLRLSELRGARRATGALILIGAPIAWGLTSWAAFVLLDFELGLALLLGAILVVTGPTVIGPLLRFVRPSGPVGRILQWEGIVNDPIGAVLAVLVFQGMLVAERGDATLSVVLGAFTAVIVGGLFGAIAAGIVVLAMRRFFVPDHLTSALVLALGIASFVASNLVLHETGLLAVTLMGILLANQRLVVVEHIVEFKENLRVLLISSLFLLLSARVPREQFQDLLDVQSFLFVGALILVVRPATVFLSTLGSGLQWREKVFLAWMAPRGIVAAAVSSVFALELAERGIPGGERLASVILLVIVLTVAMYGLTAVFVARGLGLAHRRREGVLLVGVPPWARDFGVALQEEGIPVFAVDIDREDVMRARRAGLNAHHGNVHAEELQGEFGPLGRLLAVTASDNANTLAAHELSGVFGRREVYQLAADKEPGIDLGGPHHLRGRELFEEGLTWWDLSAQLRAGAVVKRTPLTEEFDLAALRAHYGEGAILLAAVSNGSLRIFTAGNEPDPAPGETVLHLSVEPAEPKT